MAYIRYKQKMPSGNISKNYVFGSPDGLVNIDKGSLIPYGEIRNWFKALNDIEIKGKLQERLGLRGEELEVVCERLFEERDKGEWEKPFEFESRIP